MDDEPDPGLAKALPTPRLKLARVCHERAAETIKHIINPSLESQNLLPLTDEQAEIIMCSIGVACVRSSSVIAEFVAAGGDVSDFCNIDNKAGRNILLKFYDILRKVHPERFKQKNTP